MCFNPFEPRVSARNVLWVQKWCAENIMNKGAVILENVYIVCRRIETESWTIPSNNINQHGQIIIPLFVDIWKSVPKESSRMFGMFVFVLILNYAREVTQGKFDSMKVKSLMRFVCGCTQNNSKLTVWILLWFHTPVCVILVGFYDCINYDAFWWIYVLRSEVLTNILVTTDESNYPQNFYTYCEKYVFILRLFI